MGGRVRNDKGEIRKGETRRRDKEGCGTVVCVWCERWLCGGVRYSVE